MFCSECGAKNKKDSAFCAECGAKIEQESKKEKEEKVEKTTKKEPKKEEPKKEVVQKEKKPMSKKSKVLLVFILILCIALGVGYKVGSDITSPKHIAEEYIKAVINNDANKLYGYLEIKGDKTFISKAVFKDMMKGNEKSNITNFKVTEIEKQDLTATAKFTYMVKGSTDENHASIKLIKEKGKKYFIFDNWKVAETLNDEVLVEDYTIKTPKGSKLTYAGVKVDKKYLDKSESDDLYDVYVLPQVFKHKTKVVAELDDGIRIENEVTPSSYYKSVTLKFDKNSVTKEMEKEILKTSKEILNDIYEKASVSRPIEEFTTTYKHKGISLTNLEEDYKGLVAELSRAVNQLTKIEFKDLSIYALEINDDGDFEVQVKANYDYTVEYIVTGGESKTVQKSSYSYMTLIYKYEDSKFYIKDLENLKTYFSRY